MCFPSFSVPDFSRRKFIVHTGAAMAFALHCGKAEAAVAELFHPDVNVNADILQNRAPLAPNAFYFLRLGSIQPAGWLRKQLEIQANGLSGHLDQTWADVGPNSGWLGGAGESWERGPYYVDGLISLAWTLGDKQLQAKAQRFLDWTLENTTTSGMIGPRSNDDWWPRMVMLKALTQYHEATQDPRVIPVLSRYFDYQRHALLTRPLQDWGKYRWQDEALSVIWLYNRTGEPHLIELLRLLHQQGFDWQKEFHNFAYTERTTAESIGLRPGLKLTDRGMQTHGVNVAMAIKMSPVWSLVSGSTTDRNAVQQMLEELYRYHGLPNGVFSADEHLAGLNPSQGTELCTVVETMFSLEQSLAIVGSPQLGDQLELIAFNALPGAFTDDMWAHQYNQQSNQILVGLNSKPWTTDGPESNLYGLDPNFGCCAANFHQGWPKFTASLFMRSADDGLAAIAYSPCEVNTRIRGVPVRISEDTEYPFRERIRILINPQSPLTFPLLLRIPGWAQGAEISVNAAPAGTPKPDTFFRLERTWKTGDQVDITFPMSPRVSQGFQESVTFMRGPLVFSYGIGEDWLKLRNRGMTADWQVYPTTQWNYAVAIDPQNAEVSVSIKEKSVTDTPFARETPPVCLEVGARKLPSWVGLDGVAEPVPQSPVVTELVEEKITLIPYAAAKLRITAFPHLKS